MGYVIYQFVDHGVEFNCKSKIGNPLWKMLMSLGMSLQKNHSKDYETL